MSVQSLKVYYLVQSNLPDQSFHFNRRERMTRAPPRRVLDIQKRNAELFCLALWKESTFLFRRNTSPAVWRLIDE